MMEEITGGRQTDRGRFRLGSTRADELPGVHDDLLATPTPCENWAVGDLLDHLLGLTLAFRLGAEKAPDPVPSGPPQPSVANLDQRWRNRLPTQLDMLVAAWGEPAAWEGEAAVVGLTGRHPAWQAS